MEEPQPAMDKITQEMKYRYSLVNYALKYGVSKASRRYNRARSYIYYWLKRFDGAIGSLAAKSRRPHHHPNQHTQEEIALIIRYRRRNAELGLLEFWFKLRKQGYTRHYVSLYRVERREGLERSIKPRKKGPSPKPYEAMLYPGQRVQIDVKHVPRECIQDKTWGKYYQYTAIDEYSRLRYLAAYQQADTFSSADFISKAVRWFSSHGIRIDCVQTDNGPEFTSHYSKREGNDRPNLFQRYLSEHAIKYKRIKPYTPRHNGKVERSHREDQKRFYDRAKFFSFEDFQTQLRRHNQRTNKIPMRPLKFLSPLDYLKLTVQNV